MSSLQHYNPFNNTLVRRFLNWKQGDEEDTWRNKAVDALVKKLKRQPNEQYSNLQLVLNQKNENTPCITLSRSQDGRLQVSHRKMLPHVMYCRIFRWPDLQSQHELRSVPTCQYPAQRREANKICVNPYHYNRVDHSLWPPVVTPRSNEFASASPPPQSPLSPGVANYLPQQPNLSPYFNSNPPALHLTPVPQPAHHQTYQSQSFHQQENPNSDPLNYIRNQHQVQNNQPHSSLNYYGGQSPLSESNWYGSPPNSVGGQTGEPMISLANSPRTITQFDSPPPGYTSRDQQPISLIPMDTDNESQQTNTTLNGSEEGPEHWCRITYAELNQKIGEPFKGSSPKVIVDGFTDPQHNRRFSLGVLSNINRNSTIEMTRRAIRKGVCLENNDAQIHVKNLSESSIFFHSKNCNVENQLNQHAVIKIEPQGRQKIFDQKVFENLVREAIKSQDGRSYERLFSLTEHCIIKMSFVKGWGSIYLRQDVTSTPCWIEIHLLKPYALIDQYLQQVGPPSCQITSTS